MKLELTVDTDILMIGTGMSNLPCMSCHDAFLDSLQNNDSVYLAMDHQDHMRREYERKMREDSNGRKWLTRLLKNQKVAFHDIKKLPDKFHVKLGELHFDPGDYHLIRMAMSTTSRTIVSEDPDFTPQICKLLKKDKRVE